MSYRSQPWTRGKSIPDRETGRRAQGGNKGGLSRKQTTMLCRPAGSPWVSAMSFIEILSLHMMVSGAGAFGK